MLTFERATNNNVSAIFDHRGEFIDVILKNVRSRVFLADYNFTARAHGARCALRGGLAAAKRVGNLIDYSQAIYVFYI